MHGRYCWCGANLRSMRLNSCHPEVLSAGYCLLHRITFHQTETEFLGDYTSPIALLESQSQRLTDIRNLRQVPLPQGGANSVVQLMLQQSLGTRLKLVPSQDLLA